jgi:hypothetical protein
MNINFGTFLMQCAALSVWIFLVAALYAIVEKYLDKHYPDFLRINEEPENEALGAADAPKQV